MVNRIFIQMWASVNLHKPSPCNSICFALSYIIQYLKYEFTSRETELNHEYENKIIQKKEEIYVFIRYVKLFKSMNL